MNVKKYFGIFIVVGIFVAILINVNFTKAEITFDNTDIGTLISIPRVLPPSFISLIQDNPAIIQIEIDEGFWQETRVWYDPELTNLNKREIKRWFQSIVNKYDHYEGGLMDLPGLDPASCFKDTLNSSKVYGIHVVGGIQTINPDDPYCIEVLEIMNG